MAGVHIAHIAWHTRSYGRMVVYKKNISFSVFCDANVSVPVRIHEIGFVYYFFFCFADAHEYEYAGKARGVCFVEINIINNKHDNAHGK